MGDPRRQRKKFNKPSHPWQATRLDEERETVKSYGLKNKKELWKHASFLRQMKKQTKALISRTDEQGTKERELLLKRANKLGILPQGAVLDDILELTTQDILNRRLQTIVFSKKYANTQKQARQFITHQHIIIGDKKIDVPSYIVKTEEEATIMFDNSSALSDIEHPERARGKEDTILKPEEIKQETKPKVEEKKVEEKKETLKPEEVKK